MFRNFEVVPRLFFAKVQKIIHITQKSRRFIDFFITFAVK